MCDHRLAGGVRNDGGDYRTVVCGAEQPDQVFAGQWSLVTQLGHEAQRIAECGDQPGMSEALAVARVLMGQFRQIFAEAQRQRSGGDGQPLGNLLVDRPRAPGQRGSRRHLDHLGVVRFVGTEFDLRAGLGRRIFPSWGVVRT